MEIKRVHLNADFNELQIELKSGASLIKKLEPRVMGLLLLLLKNRGQLVTREQIIFEIWDNYEGADESLNQAVSILRKNLSDTDLSNRIIKTVPKKGYILFNDKITFTTGRSGDNFKKRHTYQVPKIKKSHALIIILIVIITGLLWSQFGPNQDKSKTVISVGKPD